MAANYVKTTFRSLRRDFNYALINILGLAVGLACFILLALYLESQFSYDRHFDNHDNIFRMVSDRNVDGSVNRPARSSGLVPPVLVQEYPEIRDFVRFRPASSSGRTVFRNGNTTVYWENVFLADDSLFQVFSHNIIYGDPENGLVDPTTVAISETVSRAYFGDRNPVGETLETDTAAYTVTVVFEDLPDNTHLRYNAILSYNRLEAFGNNGNIEQGSWNLSDFNYLLMEDDFQPSDFAEISDTFYEQYMADIGIQYNMTNRFILEPLAQIHYNSTTDGDFPRGNPFYIYTFAAIGILVLIIALINYINLATVRSIRRTKEIGMRKVLGAEKRSLMGHCLAESVTYSLVAVILACLILAAVLTFTGIDTLLGNRLEFNFLERPSLLFMLAVLAILTGLASGLYPAFYLAAIQPIAAFQEYKGSGRTALVRQGLVFLQFAISIAVITCTLIMSLQMRFLQNRDLGFDKDKIVLVTVRGADLIEQLPAIAADLALDSRIESAGQAQNIFGQNFNPFTANLESEAGPMQQVDINSLNIGPGWIETLGISLLQGRDLNPVIDDPHAGLVNQTLVDTMGWTNPLGKTISYPDDPEHRDTVIGVIDDFHFKSLHQQTEPLVAFLVFNDFGDMPALNRSIQNSTLAIRLADPADPSNLEFLQEKWREYDPGHPFEYEFVSDVMANLYLPEQRQVTIIGLFAGICIFISCLGLFGLSAYNTTRRARELSIRTVLGASPVRLIVLLFSNTIGLIVMASVIAAIASFLVLSSWLSNFEYRENLTSQWEIFLIATIFAILVAFCTVAMQAFKAIRVNPATNLRLDA